MRVVRVFSVLILLALVVAASLPSFAQSAENRPLTNTDLVRLVKAGVPENSILRLMQISETNFTTSANALIDLKHHHVPDRVIEALFGTQRSGNGFQNEPTMDPTESSGPMGSGAHGLPSFDATMKLNGKANAKIAVRQNHINVENGGHPLLSLSWKIHE